MTLASAPAEASTEFLTDAFRQAGALGTGQVGGVEVLASIKKIRSHTFRLRLTYEGPSASAPASIILKMGHEGQDRPPYLNRNEIAFYRDIAPTLPEHLVPRCFAAADATASSPWRLLLEDLTETHALASEHPLPPVHAACQRIVQRWGRLHAALWDDPRLSLFSNPSASETWPTYLRQSASRYALFIDRFAELMPVERRRLYERLLDNGPRILARFKLARPLTLIHGDAHWWNCFIPKDSVQDEVRLIDWEDWSAGIGVTDIAYMMAMLWFPELRRAAERPLLDCYHEALLGNGVGGYSRQMLADDYRWSVLFQTLRPIWQATSNLPARVWWPNLERNLLAFEDLDCCALLD